MKAGIVNSKTDRPAAYNNSNSQPPSYGHATPEYPMVSDMPPYSNVPDTANVWPSSVPCSLPSTVSSPSSPGAPEEYGNNYFPTSAPSTVIERSSMPPAMNSPAASCMGGGDMGFDDTKPGNFFSSPFFDYVELKSNQPILEFGCPPQIGIVPISPTYQQPPWNVYPVYYQASPAPI